MNSKFSTLLFVIVMLGWMRPCAAETGRLDLSMRPFDLTPDSMSTPEAKYFVSPALGSRHTWTALALAAPVAFWHQILAHEGSHALAGWMLGRRITGFYPYPHRHDDNFYMGRITCEYDQKSDGRQLVFSMAPAMSDVAAFVVSDAILSTRLEVDTPGGAVLFVMGMVAPMVDFVANFAGGGDWQKARSAAGQRAWMLNAAGAVVSAVMIYRVIYHARKLF